MKRTLTWRVLASTLSTVCGLAGMAVAADAPVKKVLVIGIDGLRPDAMMQADAPRLQSLVESGAYSLDAQGESLTFSGPNWSTIMSGVSIDKHRVRSNNYKDSDIRNWPDFFTYLEKHNPDWITARLLTWDAFRNNQPTGADHDLFHDYRRGGDQQMIDQAVRLLAGADPEIRQDPDALFVYQADVDVVGHDTGFGPQSKPYMQAVAVADKQVGQLLDAIAARPNRAQEQWLILVVSDHGGSMDRRHHGNTPERRIIPFIVAGEAAAPGRIFPNPRNVDVGKTVLAWMDVPIDPAWQLDGHAVGLESSAPPFVKYGENLIFNGDAEYDRGFAQDTGAAHDQYASGWRDDGPAMINILTYEVDADKHPDHLSPADAEAIGGGKNFFSGGHAAVSRIAQTIDLTPLASDIDAKKVELHLSALLGGWKDQPDCAAFTARFHDSSGYVTQTVTVGPVSASDRKNRTGLLPRQVTELVTPGARSVTVELLCIRVRGGANDGYADNLSLVLTERVEDGQ